jgi:hypothetical protein
VKVLQRIWIKSQKNGQHFFGELRFRILDVQELEFENVGRVRASEDMAWFLNFLNPSLNYIYYLNLQSRCISKKKKLITITRADDIIGFHRIRILPENLDSLNGVELKLNLEKAKRLENELTGFQNNNESKIIPLELYKKGFQASVVKYRLIPYESFHVSNFPSLPLSSYSHVCILDLRDPNYLSSEITCFLFFQNIEEFHFPDCPSWSILLLGVHFSYSPQTKSFSLYGTSDSLRWDIIPGKREFTPRIDSSLAQLIGKYSTLKFSCIYQQLYKSSSSSHLKVDFFPKQFRFTILSFVSAQFSLNPESDEELSGTIKLEVDDGTSPVNLNLTNLSIILQWISSLPLNRDSIIRSIHQSCKDSSLGSIFLKPFSPNSFDSSSSSSTFSRILTEAINQTRTHQYLGLCSILYSRESLLDQSRNFIQLNEPAPSRASPNPFISSKLVNPRSSNTSEERVQIYCWNKPELLLRRIFPTNREILQHETYSTLERLEQSIFLSK